jgi:hypothetical protein
LAGPQLSFEPTPKKPGAAQLIVIRQRGIMNQTMEGNMYRKLLYFVIVVLISGCATGERIVRLEPGMSTTNVVDVMGRPDGYKAQDSYEVLRYTNRLISLGSWDRADYNVVMKDGKLVEYGAGEVRTKQVGTSTILFIAPNR